MDKKVYYGEYSLKHWINLLLKKNLELPPYQRCFVWTEDQVKGFVNGVQEDFFVPPVTIGVCNIDGKNHNLILDGQQRLSSILLSFFKVYPRKNVFPRNVREMADGVAEEDSDEPNAEFFNWSLRLFADKGPTEKGVRDSITNEQYDIVDYGVSEDFFENKYLPFSFIIPNIADGAEQHEFYSSVFRNINILGTPLNPIESRQSLYFLKAELKDFFDPECCKNLKIELVGKNQAFDFVRTMSILSQYKKLGNVKALAQTYKNKMEKFYEEYIYAVVKDLDGGMFAKFSTIFPNQDYTPRIAKLSEALQTLEYENLHFTSIIDADVYMFGLVYFLVIEGCEIDFERKETLMRRLSTRINTFKKNESHKSSPSLLKHMRDRVKQSVRIFKCYAIHSAE